MSLFIELKRRTVFRVGLAYVVTGWLLMQVGEGMAPALRLPDWVLSALAFFLVLGLPLVLIFAWVFELTPEGLKRESEVDRSTPGTQNTRRERRYAKAARIAVQPTFSDTVARGYGRVIAALALELDGRTEEAQRLRRAAALELAEEVAQPYAETYAWPHLVQALNLVRMGEPEAALASCRRAMDIMPIERDKVHGFEIAESCAWVKAQAGRVDEALDDLERSRPVYNMGPRSLSLMPEWDFLRGNARFQALAEQGEMTK